MQISIESIHLHLLAVALAMVRTLSALAVFPFFAKESVPVTTRTGIALVFSLILVPDLVLKIDVDGIDVWSASALLIKEAAIGALIGFSFGLVFWAMETVGHIIDFQTGLTFSQSVDAMMGNQTSVTARLTMQVFSVYFLAIGGLKVFLEALYASHAVWPIMTYFPHVRSGWMSTFSDQTSMLFSLGLLFAASTLILLLLTEFGVGLLSSAAPSMHVDETMRPVKQWLATLVLMITLPFILMRTFEIVGGMRNIIPLLQQVI